MSSAVLAENYSAAKLKEYILPFVRTMKGQGKAGGR